MSSESIEPTAFDHAKDSSKVTVSASPSTGTGNAKMKGRKVTVFYGEKQIFRAKVRKSMDVMRRSLAERGDPNGIWEAEISLNLAFEK